MPARFEQFEGTIEFVSEEYITLCVGTKPNPEGSRQPMNKCCLCVYPHQWDDLEIDDSHFKNVKNYQGKPMTTQEMRCYQTWRIDEAV